MGRPIYQGSNSCYALREGMYVKRIQRPGIDTVAEAVAILRLILRDYRRGYTWDDSSKYCTKIPMTHDLFERRARYVKTLAAKHGATRSELQRIDQIIDYVIKYKRLPKTYNDRARKMIVKTRKKTVKKTRRRRRRR